jgi:hypothetical protein
MSKTSWLDLNSAAKEALKTPEIRGHCDGFLHFTYEPSLANEFSLMLIWEKSVCQWQRLYWEKDKDSAKFGIMEELRYLGQTLLPTLVSTKGILPDGMFQALLTLLRVQTLPIGPIADRYLTLDGEDFSLTVGAGEHRVAYRWRSLPTEWAGLEELKSILMEMSDRLSAEHPSGSDNFGK